mmetsp:Transcript_23236/g.64809  ORF Transcript_23236/g.64809 Transcript_23236/m.64809 type:complete len:200 (-) Transcript_23236:259-858(-)
MKLLYDGRVGIRLDRFRQHSAQRRAEEERPCPHPHHQAHAFGFQSAVSLRQLRHAGFAGPKQAVAKAHHEAPKDSQRKRRGSSEEHGQEAAGRQGDDEDKSASVRIGNLSPSNRGHGAASHESRREHSGVGSCIFFVDTIDEFDCHEAAVRKDADDQPCLGCGHRAYRKDAEPELTFSELWYLSLVLMALVMVVIEIPR